jgi:hypothetical protein
MKWVDALAVKKYLVMAVIIPLAKLVIVEKE